ncbi:peptidoglycan-binding domain-containing protein [Terrabacter sp. NPDC000476]|uniref:peptidoglycan-binding domain-containing protein n=1 Tax=Terrabacter sp. NPDC000476 TaxID=3154258 RepID=UPI00332F3FAC
MARPARRTARARTTDGARSTGTGHARTGVALALAAALALGACSSSTPSTPAGATPSVTASAVGPETTAPNDPRPVPTESADPLTPTRPTPSATTPPPSTPATVAPTPAPTPPTPSATTATTAPADPGSVAGSCERTLTAYPVLAPGANGPAVRALQCFLNDADYGPVAVDGVYGDRTRAAVKRVEATYEGPAPKPGRIDSGTWVLLISRSLGTATLEQGATGADVTTLQRALRAAGATVTVDGVFGAATKRAVERLQDANRIGADGVVGEETLFLLKMGATIG